MEHIWNIFIQSNTFNFVIFAAIFVWIFKKIDIKSAIANLQSKIVEMIDAAKKEREKAIKELKASQKAVKNIGQEVEKIITDAETSADMIAKKVLDDAKKQAKSIEINAKKIIDAEQKSLISAITRKASTASIDKARENLVNKLQQDKSLHDKFIDDSINELDRLEL